MAMKQLYTSQQSRSIQTHCVPTVKINKEIKINAIICSTIDLFGTEADSFKDLFLFQANT